MSLIPLTTESISRIRSVLVATTCLLACSGGTSGLFKFFEVSQLLFSQCKYFLVPAVCCNSSEVGAKSSLIFHLLKCKVLI